MPDQINVIAPPGKPNAGEIIPISGDEESVAAAKAKGYTLAPAETPSVDTTDLEQQAKYPASAPAFQQEANSKIPEGATENDVNPDGTVKVVKDGKSFDITADPESIMAAKAKGYRFNSDYQHNDLMEQQRLADEAEHQKDIDQSIKQEGPVGLKGADVDFLHKILNPQQFVLNLKTPEQQERFKNIWKDITGKEVSPKLLEEVSGKEEFSKNDIRNFLTKLPGYDSAEATLAGLGNNIIYDALKAGTHLNDSHYQQGLVDVTKEEHPYAYWGGAAAREGVTALAGGELGEAVSGAAKLTGATRLLAEGAAYGTPNAAVDMLNGKPGQAAEDIALGGLGNILAHGLFSIAKNSIAPTVGAASSQALDEAAASIWKTMGAQPNEVSSIRAEAQNLVKQEVIKSNATVADNLEKIQSLESEAKTRSLMKQMDAIPNRDGIVIDALTSARKQIFEMATHPNLGENSKEVQLGLTPWANKLDTTIKNPTFDNINATSKYFAEHLGDVNPAVAEAKQQVYDVFKKTQADLENAAVKQLDKPQLANDLAQMRARAAIGEMLENASPKKSLGKSIENVMTNPDRHGDLPATLQALGISNVPGSSPLQDLGGQVGKALQVFQKNAVAATAKITQQQDTQVVQSAKNLMQDLKLGRTAKVATFDSGLALNSYVPNNGSGLSNEQKLNKIREDVIHASTNPNLLTQHLATITQPLREAGLEKVAQAYSDQQLRLMKVIQTIIPKDPIMAEAHPFSAKVEESDISPATKTKMARILTLAAQPETLLDLVKSNNISAMDVAICGAVNPETLQRMREAVVNEAIKSKPDLSYQQRLSMSIFMGTNIDQSTAPFPMLQDVYVPFTPTMGGQPNSKPHKMGQKDKEGIADSYQTVSQEAQGQ